ncbi:hypothetical protein GALMADRAFT_1352243 [Galerina marginata CBS 339.88]|uniref:Major facilitator superfamily (MFS) profile domain-containing protein n=1 Tax=Galerina marginata (strain CBS 339.88) TaxID=685588 RepID=A0A067SFF1_GALM3|nr:hypothetical protein GALMADRAFT_1352243 [Galerina marginata CBS 339.88]
MSLKERIKKVSLIFACGTALFADGSHHSISNLRRGIVLTRIYGAEKLSEHNYSRKLTSLAFAGTIVGMLVFGYLSDKIGRKFGMMAATAIIALFSGLSAASSGAHGSVDGLLSMLSAMRFLLGVGLGAEYPCGSVAASEQSEEPGISEKVRHRWFTLATNVMVDFGFVLGSFVPLVFFWIFGNDHLRAVWRLSLGFGIVPAAVVFLWRLNMDEPTRYKRDSMKHAAIPYKLVLRRYSGRLAAISFTWFLYDFIVYPFGLYASIILDRVTGGSTSLVVVFGWNVVINLFYMPGSIVGAFYVDRLGAKNTMILGLLIQALLGFIMSGLYLTLTNHIAAFAVVYGLFLTFGEFGPGNCIKLLAGKTSPTAIRGQFYGAAAAVGKVGAFVGTWSFPPMIDAFGGPNSTRGNTGPFWVGSGMAILSALITFFFVSPIDAEGMVIEDNKFREYLEANGYDTAAMGLTAIDVSVNENSSMEKSDEKNSADEHSNV